MKKYILIISLLCPIILFGQESDNKSSHDKDVIESLMKHSTKQLLDTASYYYNRSSLDTALICYNLLMNIIPKNADIEEQKILFNAYNKSAIIYAFLADYRTSYSHFIKALNICEKYNFNNYKSSILMNIGIIYRRIDQLDIAKEYYLKSLELCNDSLTYINLLNSLGIIEILNNKLDSSFYYFNKSISISKRHNSFNLGTGLNNLGSYYQYKKEYDSAFYYFRASLYHNKKSNNLETEAINLSDFGKLFLEVNEIDSALYYIDLSNKIASENNFLKIQSDNLLVLSEIERSKGRYEDALNHFITFINLKDSIYNGKVFGDINQLQRIYEVSKTNQQIEDLILEKQIKERTIKYQKIILGLLLLLIIVLGIVVYQKKKLKKYSKLSINDQKQRELLNKILTVMEDVQIICDTDFSSAKLAGLVNSNSSYISEIINKNFHKNFRTLLNGYRIKEAQRLFNEFDSGVYNIEFVSTKVGYKSSKTFREAFKEVTGITPSYYLKSLEEKKSSISN